VKYYSISVIVPTYNYGHFIKDALESLFRQIYPEELVEIIVVDDGSTDDTRGTLKEYMDKIIYVYQENKGIASARNLGMSLAKHEVITFLDSDDIWHEGRLQKIVDKFNEKQDAGMVYHPVEVINEAGSIIHKNFYKTFGYKEGLSGWITNKILSGQIFCGGSSFAFRKSIIDRIYPVPDDIRRGVDYYISVISSFYAQVGYISDILSKYRVHNSNLTLFSKELAMVNRDLAYMRQKVIDKILSLDSPDMRKVDLGIIKRIQAKEMIFYNVLTGKRLDGIKRIPLLFKGNLSVKDLFKGIVISFMSLFIPAFLYYKLVKVYELFKKIKISGSTKNLLKHLYWL
jgi:glycosyltransferase involved in cell wall biosynthesis